MVFPNTSSDVRLTKTRNDALYSGRIVSVQAKLQPYLREWLREEDTEFTLSQKMLTGHWVSQAYSIYKAVYLSVENNSYWATPEQCANLPRGFFSEPPPETKSPKNRVINLTTYTPVSVKKWMHDGLPTGYENLRATLPPNVFHDPGFRPYLNIFRRKSISFHARRACWVYYNILTDDDGEVALPGTLPITRLCHYMMSPDEMLDYITVSRGIDLSKPRRKNGSLNLF